MKARQYSSDNQDQSGAGAGGTQSSRSRRKDKCVSCVIYFDFLLDTCNMCKFMEEIIDVSTNQFTLGDSLTFGVRV